MVKALKAIAKFNWQLSNLVAFIRLNLFVKIDIQKWLDKPFEEHKEPPEKNMQGGAFLTSRFQHNLINKINSFIMLLKSFRTLLIFYILLSTMAIISFS
jgi:hypothetical protein